MTRAEVNAYGCDPEPPRYAAHPRLAAYARAQEVRAYVESQGVTVLGAGDVDNGSSLWVAFKDTLGVDRMYRFGLHDSAPDIAAQLIYAAARAGADLDDEISNFKWRGAK